MAGLHVPPGRAGRLWLRNRLDLAEHGLSLLERKLLLLEQERTRLRELAEQARTDWASACRTARTWQLRAELLSGSSSLTTAAPLHPADITVHWTTTAGVRYPNDVDCALPDDPADVITGSTTLARTITAHRVAIAAAARCAAADAAARSLACECTATRIRAQGLRRRRIPELRTALAITELALEEQERAEGIRLRRTATRDGSAGVGSV